MNHNPNASLNLTCFVPEIKARSRAFSILSPSLPRTAWLLTGDYDITRTEQDGTITYAALIDGKQVSYLNIDATTRQVWNIETADGFTRQGFARALWETANDDAECFHALDHHRTAEGNFFAHGVGGATISDELGYVAECGICSEH